jgi:hypothetical protein
MEALGREIRRISMPLDLIRERYDVIVVGSGYGGAIAASGYGHIDCIFGATASRDVYPLIRRHLEETA